MRRRVRAMVDQQFDCWRDDLAGFARLRVITNVLTRVRLCTVEGRMEFAHKGAPVDSPRASLRPTVRGPGFANFNTPSLLTSSVAVHTLGYLLVTGLVAMLVYEKLGVGMLRRAWFNVDLFWMFALMATGVFILFL